MYNAIKKRRLPPAIVSNVCQPDLIISEVQKGTRDKLYESPLLYNYINYIKIKTTFEHNKKTTTTNKTLIRFKSCVNVYHSPKLQFFVLLVTKRVTQDLSVLS